MLSILIIIILVIEKLVKNNYNKTVINDTKSNICEIK